VSSGGLLGHRHGLHPAEIELDPKLVDRMRPDVQARRTKYVRYVAAVCAGCALLGVVALVKMMLQ